jgi:alpha-methylacyl-CoA racemase
MEEKNGTVPITNRLFLFFCYTTPGPFAGLHLADAGASVLRIDRAIPGQTHTPGVEPPATTDLLTRHKTSIAVDLKDARGVALIKELARNADVVIDPFRPGVLERLGLGPSELCGANPRLIYGRMTGFRRDGRYRDMAGHDINYLAVGGVLSMLGRKDAKPTPPINILGDFAGGGAVLFQGILLALLARDRNGGRGQVVEANMVDGSSFLATFPRFALKTPMGDGPRGDNVLDSGCPYYDTYKTGDDKYMAVGALEPQFYKVLIKGLGLAGKGWEQKRYDRDTWPEMREVFTSVFQSKTRAEWEAVFDGTDACCTPVFEYGEMEADILGKEGDQRPSVTLRDTPCLALRPDASDPSHGQGAGVEGQGYSGQPLGAGVGGEDTLRQWFGWSKGSEFDMHAGGLVLKTTCKL